MLRDVPYCRSILACGAGGLVLSVLFLTLVYPLFCNRVSYVKETKVREYMQERYGISDDAATMLRSDSDADRELPKVVSSDSDRGEALPDTGSTDDEPASVDRNDAADVSGGDALPPAKRR
ncbi:MAG: hypothetical protein ACLFU7_12845 [Armatimonadota bacterium]